jgi:SAM-dependent methyltransferase
MFGDVQLLLDRIKSTDRVLDVGGWACPFNRANWILDSEPYETRGFYATIGMPAFQGGDIEHFSKETWVQRDICDHEPWPFADQFFDFSICSHTLEDIRDPLFICSELIRVSKAGYIEVPSRLSETCRGREHPNVVGLSHHRWLIEISGDHIRFTPKFHMIHGDFQLSFPAEFANSLAPDEHIATLFWQDIFTYSETKLDGLSAIHAELENFVKSHYRYPRYKYYLQNLCRNLRRIAAGLKRRMKRKGKG